MATQPPPDWVVVSAASSNRASQSTNQLAEGVVASELPHQPTNEQLADEMQKLRLELQHQPTNQQVVEDVRVLRQEFQQLRQEMKQGFQQSQQETQKLRQEMKQGFQQMQQEFQQMQQTQQQFQQQMQQTQRQFQHQLSALIHNMSARTRNSAVGHSMDTLTPVVNPLTNVLPRNFPATPAALNDFNWQQTLTLGINLGLPDPGAYPSIDVQETFLEEVRVVIGLTPTPL